MKRDILIAIACSLVGPAIFGLCYLYVALTMPPEMKVPQPTEQQLYMEGMVLLSM